MFDNVHKYVHIASDSYLYYIFIFLKKLTRFLRKTFIAPIDVVWGYNMTCNVLLNYDYKIHIW